MGSPKAASSPSSVTQTTVQEVPEEVKPLLGRYLSQGEALSKTPFSAYSGERVAGLNPYHNAGGDLAATRAIYGDPGVEAGKQHVAGMLSGDYYNSPAFAHASRRDWTTSRERWVRCSGLRGSQTAAFSSRPCAMPTTSRWA